MVIVFLPALEGLRPQWREAAVSLGATTWQYWTRVAVPLLRPAFLGATLLLFANAFVAYATAAALVSQGRPILPLQIRAALTSEVVLGRANLALALALEMIVVVAVVMTAYALLLRRTVAVAAMRPPAAAGASRAWLLLRALRGCSSSSRCWRCWTSAPAISRAAAPARRGCDLVHNPDLSAAIVTSLGLALLTVARHAGAAGPDNGLGAAAGAPARRLVEFLCLLPLTIPALVLVVGMRNVYAWVNYFVGGSVADPDLRLRRPGAALRLSRDRRGLSGHRRGDAVRGGPLPRRRVGHRHRAAIVVPNIGPALLSAAFVSVALVLGEFTIASLHQLREPAGGHRPARQERGTHLGRGLRWRRCCSRSCCCWPAVVRRARPPRPEGEAVT